MSDEPIFSMLSGKVGPNCAAECAARNIDPCVVVTRYQYRNESEQQCINYHVNILEFDVESATQVCNMCVMAANGITCDSTGNEC